jgi:hypothetical protein
MDWAAGITGATEGDPLLTKEEIEDIVDGVVSTFGEFHTDPSTIPTTATSRPRGAFDSPNDLKNYLASGGLLGEGSDGSPLPMSIVHILKITIPGRANPIYEVWIDDNT